MWQTLDFLRGLLILVVGVALLGWGLYYWYANTREEQSVLLIKWIVSLVAIAGTILLSRSAGPFMVIFALLGGLVLAVLWTPTIAGWVVGKFDDLFTGGSQEVEPAPFYSVAEGRRKRGQYVEALEEIDRQLERFPDDLQGHLMRAEIHARDLKDLPTAHALIETFCAEEDRAPEAIAVALSTLADWHLDLAQAPEEACQLFRQIVLQFPGTPQATAAEQRLDRLSNVAEVKAAKDRTPIKLKAGLKDVGLARDLSSVERKAEDPELTVASLALHLDAHPRDVEAREQLARLYAEHYRDLDLVREQVEYLLLLANQPPRQHVRWLNQLADYEILLGHSYEGICATLQRIIDMEPHNAAAQQARDRMTYVRLNLKAHEKSRVIRFEPKSGGKDTPS